MNTFRRADRKAINFVLFAATAIYVCIGVWLYFKLGVDWNNLPTSLEQRSAAIRNVVLAGIAIIGLPLAIWRSWIAKGQLDRSNDQVKIANDNARFAETGRDLDRFQKGMQMLGDNTDSERIGGIITLDHLARDKPDDYGRIVIDALNGVIERESLKRPKSAEFDLHRAFHAGEIAQQPIMNEIVKVAARHPQLCKAEGEYQWNFHEAVFCSLSLDGGNLTNTELGLAAFHNCAFQKTLFPENFHPAPLIPGTLFSTCVFFDINFGNQVGTFVSKCNFFRCSFFGAIGAPNIQLGDAFLRRNDFMGCDFSGVSFRECDYETLLAAFGEPCSNWAWDDRAPILPEHGRFGFPDGFLVDHGKRSDFEAAGKIGHPPKFAD